MLEAAYTLRLSQWRLEAEILFVYLIGGWRRPILYVYLSGGWRLQYCLSISLEAGGGLYFTSILVEAGGCNTVCLSH